MGRLGKLMCGLPETEEKEGLGEINMAEAPVEEEVDEKKDVGKGQAQTQTQPQGGKGKKKKGVKEEAEEEKEDLGLIGGLSKRSAHSAKLSSSEIKIMYCIAKVARSSMDPPLLFGEI
ncbi:hypothetical protein H4I96_11289 [Botrytis cinerea]